MCLIKLKRKPDEIEIDIHTHIILNFKNSKTDRKRKTKDRAYKETIQEQTEKMNFGGQPSKLRCILQWGQGKGEDEKVTARL